MSTTTTSTTSTPILLDQSSSSTLSSIFSVFSPVFSKLTSVAVVPFISGALISLGEYSVRMMYLRYQKLFNPSSKYDPMATFVTNGIPLKRRQVNDLKK